MRQPPLFLLGGFSLGAVGLQLASRPPATPPAAGPLPMGGLTAGRSPEPSTFYKSPCIARIPGRFMSLSAPRIDQGWSRSNYVQQKSFPLILSHI